MPLERERERERERETEPNNTTPQPYRAPVPNGNQTRLNQGLSGAYLDIVLVGGYMAGVVLGSLMYSIPCCFSIPYCIRPYYTILYYIISYCIILYYIIIV